MFQGLRKHSQSFFIVILIASLATVFGINFGPSQGCRSGAIKVAHVARVYGNNVSEQDFRTLARFSSLRDLSGDSREARDAARSAREAIVNRLVERELLAHEAERLGFRVSDDELNRDIRDGYFYNAMGNSLDRFRWRQSHQLAMLAGTGPGEPPPMNTREWTSYRSAEREGDPPPPFHYEDFETWVRNVFGRTVREYKLLMTREILAQRIRDSIMSGVQVSEDEAWRTYERSQTTVTLRYLQFSPTFYRLTARDDVQSNVDAFARAHETEINERYTRQRSSYQGLPAQVRLRQIVLTYPTEGGDPARIATRQRAEAIHARVTAPGGDFVRTARLYSQDESTWRTAGETGWVAVDSITPEDVRRAVATLQRGQISAVIPATDGVHIVQLVDRREGNVAEAEAKADIARELYREQTGAERAAAAAARAQQLLNAPGATLDGVSSAIHADALREFYHGDVPAAETLPGNNPLEAQTHTDLGAPEIQETPAFRRDEAISIAHVDETGPLVQAAYELTGEHPAGREPVVLGDERLVIALRNGGRQNASREEFNRVRLERMEELLHQRRQEVLEQYVLRLRAEAQRRGDVRTGNSPLIQERRAGSTNDNS
jgi:peptidyl-prolyl cis-trans isomerase D